MKIPVILILGLSSQFCTTPGPVTSHQSCERSSAIPERREYPVQPSINPCDNFYQYACSEALSCFQLREDRSRHLMAFNDADERLLLKKEAYFEDLEKQKHKKGWTAALNTLYSSCTDEKSRANEETQLVHKTLKKLDSLKTRNDLQKFLAERTISGDYAFVSFFDDANLEDADWSDIFLDPRVMTLPEPTYYKKPELMHDFKIVLTDFFKTVGKDRPEERADNVIAFEKKMSEVSPLPEDIRKLAVEKRYINRNTLLAQYPSLHLDILLNKIPKRTVIRHIFPDAMKLLSDELANGSMDTLKDVYMFQTLFDKLDNGYPDFFQKKFAFNSKHLGGPPKRSELKERCAKYVAHRYSMELDHELIDVLFPNFPVEKFENLVDSIRLAMLAKVEKNTWLSPQGKEGALRKLRSVKMKLVKPRNKKEWDLQELGPYKKGTFLANAVLREQLAQKKLFKELKHKRNKDKWSLGPLTVNAYYDPSTNTFNMLQGILQYPFFDPNGSAYENFGSIGTVVGHEIGHAFDDNGAKYDEHGVLKQWMTDEDIATFQKLGSQLVDDYNKAGGNGKLTLGENIADTVGLNFSYAAAFPNGEGKKEDKQAFYLQFARSWCGVMRPAEMERRLKVDPHSQTEVRANEPLKHQKGFYEAFECKSGDKMYLPEKQRLQVW